MSVQLGIFALHSKPELEFVEFHKKNPKVYQELLDLALQAHARGRKKIGIKMLIEVVRWNRYLQTTGVYKINNNYAPYYARMIIEEHPELEHLFELRRIRS